MRCNEARELSWESGGIPPAEAVKQHIAGCSACRSYLADLARVRAGLRLLGREDTPEASIGFGVRVVRRLREQDHPETVAPEPLESAGRRVILATLVLVLTLLLAMILPSSGPVRHETTLDSYWTQAEAADATATSVSYAADWSSVPPAPVWVEVRPAAYRGNQ